ncbi:MAG: 2Fe-2S iron-sulfur cluster-binding protein [Chloroflexota bacterium]
MPKITVTDGDSFEVEDGKRLILALRDNDVDILHRCGGFAGCTTCRVEFSEGEPTRMTEAELNRLNEQSQVGEFRLSCQIECTQDMTVKPLMTLESTGLDDRGNQPQDNITPDPVWTEKPA